MKKRELKLEKFKNADYEKKKKIYTSIIVCVVLLLGAIIVYRTFAVFSRKVETPTISSNVPEYQIRDFKLIMTVDGVVVDTTFNEVDNGTYSIQSIACDNGATGTYNTGTKQFVVSNLTKSNTLCNVKLIKN